jgi:hypothetical protein
MMTLGDKLTEDEGEEFMRDAGQYHNFQNRIFLLLLFFDSFVCVDVGGHGQVKYHEFIKMMLYSK